MPAPTNISAGTAIDVTGLLPYTNTQTVDDAGVTYTVWYKYTFPADGVLGILGYGDLPYIPRMDSYGPNSSVVHSNISSAYSYPAQLQGHAGEEFFFRFQPNSGNPTPAVLEISFINSPTPIWPEGSLIIPDDTPGNPGIVISAVTGEVLGGIVDFPAGEQGDSILTPVVYYATENVDTYNVDVFDDTYTVINSEVPLGTAGGGTQPLLIRANKTLGKIYFLSANSSNNWILQSIDSDGTISGALTTITIGQSGIYVRSFCIANDGNIVYICAADPLGSPLQAAIKKWDIGAGAFLTNFAPAIGGYYTLEDILVLEDDTVVALYTISSSGAIKVGIYDITGSLLNLIDYGTANNPTTFHHIGYALDSPNSFWLWTHPNPVNGTSRFRNVKVSDGSDLIDFTIAEFESGVWSEDSIFDPDTDARFGISLSCPFYMVGPFGASGGTITVLKVQNGGNTGEEFDFTTTGGLTPSTFTLEDGESQAFTGLAPGTYGIAETPVGAYDTTYEVSNADPVDAIEIVGDEEILVTVTNTGFNTLSGIYKVVPDKRNDTLWESFDPEVTEDVKIPDPFFKSALFGK